MKQQQSIFLLLIMVLSLTACTVSKQLKAHRSELDMLATSQMDPKVKFDRFATVIANMLDEATDLESPIRSVRYVQRFAKQNGPEIEMITQELDGEIKRMNTARKVAFAGRAMTRPYGQKLARLIPKINRIAEAGGYDLGPIQEAFALFALKQVVKN